MADYAITNVARRVVYTGSAGVGPYAFSFPVLVNTDIAVYKNTTLLTLTTDYTVTISSTTGQGSVTLVSAATGTDRITIVGARSIQRSTDFVTGGDFFANTLNTELDSEVIFTQQIAETAERSIKAPVTDPTSISMTLPANTTRANKFLAFDSTGNPQTLNAVGTYKGNWATGTAYVLQDIVKDTSNSNIYICITAHTSTGSQPISSNADVAKWSLVVDAAAAATSATNAATSASAASTSATNAAASASTASTQASNASTSASTASTQASNASTSATNAASSASAASGSATTASTQASNASTSATNAAASASAASSSATSAAGSASTATTQASNASTSATAAAASASAASGSASTASTQATNAAASASAAATSETNAATSASGAATSASNAATSATNAANSYDAFDDRYLGAKATAPSVDNDGNALLTGALYWNTTGNQLYVWDGSAWNSAAFSTSGAVTSFNTRTGAITLTSGDVTGALTYTPQASDAELTAIAGLTSAANKGIQFTGAGTAATYDLTVAGKALLDDVDAAAQRTTLGLGTVAIENTVPVAKGGTGATTLAAASIATQGYTTTATAAGTTTLTVSSTQLQYFTGTTTQTVVLPVASTLTVGQRFEIHNNSTGDVTVQSSGLNTVVTVKGNTTAVITCILTSGTTAASWDADYTGFTSTVPTTIGGTGLSSYTTGDLTYASATDTLAKRSIGTTGQVLTVASGVPTWATPASGARSGTSYITLTTGTTNSTLTASSNQCLIISADQENCSVTLPDATTLTLGSVYFTFFNTSQYPIAIKDNGGTIREYLTPNSSNTYLKLQENSTTNGIWHIENPTLAGSSVAPGYTNIGGTTNLQAGYAISSIIKVNATQYIALTSSYTTAQNVYAKLFTVNLSTKAVTWGNQVTLYTNAASYCQENAVVVGDSNGVDRGLIVIGQSYFGTGTATLRVIGFSVVAGTLYVSSTATLFTSANVSYPKTASSVMYTGANNAFFCFAAETGSNGRNAIATGYTVTVVSTTVTITQATGSISYATVASNNWYCSPTSLTTWVVDTDVASNPRYVSYNTTTNVISGGTRTSQTTQIAGLLIPTFSSTISQYGNFGYGVTPVIFPGLGANNLITSSTGIMCYLTGNPVTVTNPGTATVTVTSGSSITYKSNSSKNYANLISGISIGDYYVNSSSSYLVIDYANFLNPSDNLINVDPTTATLNANASKYNNSWTSFSTLGYRVQGIYFTAANQTINFAYIYDITNSCNLYMNLTNLATPFVS